MDDSFAGDLTALIEQQLKLTEAIKTALFEHRQAGTPDEVDMWLIQAEIFQTQAATLLSQLEMASTEAPPMAAKQ
ncbi:hypothetical protein EGJ27_02670 [Pseudomonas sp. v388]|nr:hypothetical protein EGJ27_02670 [Pseudomonas sp. v388]